MWLSVLLLIMEEKESELQKEGDVMTETGRDFRRHDPARFENRGRGHEPKNAGASSKARKLIVPQSFWRKSKPAQALILAQGDL